MKLSSGLFGSWYLSCSYEFFKMNDFVFSSFVLLLSLLSLFAQVHREVSISEQ